MPAIAQNVLDVASLGKVLVASLLAGGGLVAVFALGLVGVSAYVGETAGGPGGTVRKPLGLLVAVVCFAVVVLGVAYGLYVMLDK